MRKKENFLNRIFQKNFSDVQTASDVSTYRHTAFYIWVISFILFFAALFFFIGTRIMFG